MAITSLTNVKQYLNITTSTYDSVLSALIPRVQDEIESYCGRAFDEADYTLERYDNAGDGWLYLKHFPITNISAVKIFKTDYVDDITDETYENYVDYTNGVIHWPFPCGYQNIEVTYTAGYTTSTYPNDLVQIGTEWTAQTYQTVGQSTGLKSESLGDYSYTRKDDSGASSVINSLKERLRPYIAIR